MYRVRLGKITEIKDPLFATEEEALNYLRLNPYYEVGNIIKDKNGLGKITKISKYYSTDVDYYQITYSNFQTSIQSKSDIRQGTNQEKEQYYSEVVKWYESLGFVKGARFLITDDPETPLD